jgi:hypothetical protein
MSQTDLMSDAFCSDNQSAAPLSWILEQGQYENTFAYGSVGVSAASNHVRPDIVNIDSFLSGRDDILSKCNPPIPALDDANEVPMTYQNSGNVNNLQPIYTREKKSSVNLASISYLPLTFVPSLPTPPQDINHIIFTGAAQRGGSNTSNIVKNAWNTSNFEAFINPGRACGKPCSEANGYMTRTPGFDTEATWGKLPQGPQSTWFNTDNTGTMPGRSNQQMITSQLATTVGASGDGSGPQYLSVAPGTTPVIGNPYDAYPRERNPATGQYYSQSTLNNLIPH